MARLPCLRTHWNGYVAPDGLRNASGSTIPISRTFSSIVILPPPLQGSPIHLDGLP